MFRNGIAYSHYRIDMGDELQYEMQEPYEPIYADTLAQAHEHVGVREPSDWFEIQQNLLLKYMEGRDLDKEDELRVRELCSIGFMKTGISLKRRKITAKTIGIGRDLANSSGFK